jgi:cytoskeleton protein RodZ
MTEPTHAPAAMPPPGAPRGGPAPSAGAMLRSAREAMGLSLDAVAQQLKLAPRQVTALEDGDFARLPGRTFVRGFLRNYARLVRVDPDRVLSALAEGDASSLDAPALQPTAPTMGELPATDRPRAGWTRWAIPLTLVAVIAAAAVYEFSRGRGEAPRMPAITSGIPAPADGPAPAPAPAAGEAALPNPIAAPVPTEATDAKEPVAAAGGTPAAAAVEPAAPAAEAPATPPPLVGEATLVLTYRDSAWTEVKDSRGKVLVSQIVGGGQTRSITGVPPLDVVIGNSSEVSVTFRDQPVDLAAVSKKNVARFILE